LEVHVSQRENVSFSERNRKRVKLILRDSSFDELFEGCIELEAGYLKTIVHWIAEDDIAVELFEVGVVDDGATDRRSNLHRVFRILSDAGTGALRLEEAQAELGTGD
jgi:hypothetical protein